MSPLETPVGAGPGIRGRAVSLAAVLLGVWLGLAGAAAEAQSAGGARDTVFPDWEFSFKSDNDTLLNTDRYYTNGLRLTALKVQGSRWFGWALANEAYTPTDITLAPEDIGPNDRPYAGWTYFSYFRGRLDDDDSSVVWEFTGGCMGPCSRSERIQRYWHTHVVDAPDPQGWSSQITDEVGLQVRRVRQRPLHRWIDDDRTLVADLERTTEFRLGNIFTDATIGVIGRVRLGNMRGYYDGAGLDDMTPKRPLSRPDGGARPWVDRAGGGWLWSDESFLFARIEGRLVGRDSTFEGGVFDGDSPFTQDIRRAVIRSEIGIKFVWRRISFAMSWNSTSTNFESAPWSLNHHNWLSFYGVVH